MPFFHFSQNNTGGKFRFDKRITHHMVIEAKDYREANGRAECLGLYFNGVITGDDCSCCGDRWHPQWRGDKGDEEPMVYGIPVAEATAHSNFKEDKGIMKWSGPEQAEIYVYRKGATEPEGYLY